MRCTTLVKPISNNAGESNCEDYPIQLAHEKVLVNRLNKKISSIRKEMTNIYQVFQDLNSGILSSLSFILIDKLKFSMFPACRAVRNFAYCPKDAFGKHFYFLLTKTVESNPNTSPINKPRCTFFIRNPITSPNTITRTKAIFPLFLSGCEFMLFPI